MLSEALLQNALCLEKKSLCCVLMLAIRIPMEMVVRHGMLRDAYERSEGERE
jgi:hypothetical protein